MTPLVAPDVPAAGAAGSGAKRRFGGDGAPRLVPNASPVADRWAKPGTLGAARRVRGRSSSITYAIDSASFTVRTIPNHLATLKRDPWEGYFDMKQPVLHLANGLARRAAGAPGTEMGRSRLVAPSPCG